MRYKISLVLMYGVLEICHATKFEIGAMIEVDKNVMKQLNEYMKQNKTNEKYAKANEAGNHTVDNRRNIKEHIKNAVASLRSYNQNELCDVFNVAVDKIKRLAVNDDDTDKAIIRNLKNLEKIPCVDLEHLLNETMLALSGKKYKGTTDWLQLLDSFNAYDVLENLKTISSYTAETLRKRSFDSDEVVRKTVRNILKVINKIHAYINEQSPKNTNLSRQQLHMGKRSPLTKEQFEKVQRKPSKEIQHRPLAEVENMESAEVQHKQSLEVQKRPPKKIKRRPSIDVQQKSSSLEVQNRPSAEVKYRPSLEDQQKASKENLYELTKDPETDTPIIPKRPSNRHHSKRTKFETKNYDPLPITNAETTLSQLLIPEQPRKKVRHHVNSGRTIDIQNLEEFIQPILGILLGGSVKTTSSTTTTQRPVINIVLGENQNPKSDESETTSEPRYKNNRIVLKLQR